VSAIVPNPAANPAVDPSDSNSSPWLTANQAAKRAQVGARTIYSAVRAGRLRAARIGGRRELRFLAAWVDEWLEATVKPIEVTRGSLRVAR
jgi:excisionase family DNA binding protein